jgi:hypothetical protein
MFEVLLSPVKIGSREQVHRKFPELKIILEPLRRMWGSVAAGADLAKQEELGPICFSRGLLRQRGRRL